MILKFGLMEYKFCYKCGGKLSKKHKGLYLCGVCNFDFYINPKTTCSLIIINKKKEILLGVRKRLPKKGFWELPGGFIDLDESAEEAAKREAKEELNLKVEDMRYFNSYPGKYRYQGLEYNVLNLVYIIKVKMIELPENSEMKSLMFFSPDNIPFDKMAFIAENRALREFFKLSLEEI
jgi:NAD+ diphosphatase